MATWPNTLPQYVLQNGFQESIQDQTLESQMDSGPAKIRRRFTQPLRKITAQMLLTASQRDTFEYFWGTTLQGGSLTFTWVHPITQSSATMRFRNPAPSYSAMGGNSYQVNFVLEVL